MIPLVMFQVFRLSRELREAYEDADYAEERWAWHAIIGKRRWVMV